MEVLSGILAEIVATVVGGILLTSIFFLFKEIIFKSPKISGKWILETKVISSAYNPYKNMILKYEAILWLEGNRIEGTLEKFYENSSEGERVLEGKQRRRGKIKGYLEKNYLKKNRILLHVVENGEGREYTTYYELEILKNKLFGSFLSTAANSKGIATWQKEDF